MGIERTGESERAERETPVTGNATAAAPFSTALVRLPAALGAFSPGPVFEDRAAWDALPEAVRHALVARGEAMQARPWPQLLASDYRAYVREGDRARFEALYFDRRRQLAALVLAECVEGLGRFLDAVIDGMMLLCEESGWQLPAHNSHVRGGPRLPLPDNERPVIDLFAAETGALLAVAGHLLAGPLDAADPAILRRVDREIERRIVTPYLDVHFWWMGDGDEPMNNWTAWCTQNVLLTVFSRPHGEGTRRRVVEQAARSLDAFWKDYGEDGACAEGALYWRHAALCLHGALDILSSVAPGAFAPLWHLPKLKAMAEFLADMQVEGPHYFNFGDASARLEPCGAREWRFGQAVGSPFLERFAASDAARAASFERPDEINLWYRLREALDHEALTAAAKGEPPRRDRHYPSIGLTVARDARFALAVKGGHNGDSHNHNDVGSVTLWRGGAPVLIDLGVETYTAKTFSPRRYEIWTMQSAWHNLPSFEGAMQADGVAFGTSEHEVLLGERETLIDMEIAGAYPPSAGLRFYRRSVRFSKGGAVEIEDRWQGERAGELSLLFAEAPQLEPGTIMLPVSGARIVVEGAGPPLCETVEIADARLGLAWGPRIWRLRLPLLGPLKLTIT